MAVFVIGDVHGQRAKLEGLLRQSGLVDAALRWTAGATTLWLMGDFVDRGPDGIGVIELAMRLQREAAAVGGAVNALLGNHDALLLAAQRFGKQPTLGAGGSFVADWRHAGGVETDLTALQPLHVAWLAALPAIAFHEDTLFAHADALLYMRYGLSIQAVNAVFAELLHSDDTDAWELLLADFSEHRAFAGRRGDKRVEEFLALFGGQRLVHGHTPIGNLTHREPEHVTAPLIYARQRCINVDGGMYLGGPGFVYRLPSVAELASLFD